MGRKFAAVVFSLGCLQANSALALGLGELKLESFLNEPLAASVDLLNTGGMHEDEIRVRLGTREDFKRLGIDRSFFLTSIEFDVVIGASGDARIVLTTDDSVLEPYLDFVVEARWPSGRLLREYTVLIDPPAFSNASTVVSASQRVEEVEGIPAPAKKKSSITETGTRVDIRKSDLGPGEMPQRGFNANAADAPSAGDRYMIKRDDTLWTIASRAKPQGATVHQTMLDIQRLNPEAFINNNINRVKAGYIVSLPSADQITSGDVTAAVTEVNEQNAAWREGRDAERASSDGPSLRISADEDKEVGSALEGGSERQAELASLEQNLDRTEMEREDAEGRVNAMENRVGTLERIVNLKDEQIAALQAALAEAQASGDASANDMQAKLDEMGDDPELRAGIDKAYQDSIDGSDAVDGESASNADAYDSEESAEATDEFSDEEMLEEPMAEETPIVKPVVVQPKPAPAAEESGGFMDYILYIIGAAILAVLGFFLLRRRGEDDSDDSGSDEVFSDVRLSEPNLDIEEEEPAGLAEELAAVAAAPVAAGTRGYGERKHDAYASDVEAADALAEADIYIAYGRHRQAIELLNNALMTEPNNPVYRLKLLEIHTELNNHADASEQLHQLRSIGDADSLARGEELLASFESGSGGEATAVTAIAEVDEPGLVPNPLNISKDGELDGEFSGLEIEFDDEDEDDEELDLSDDFEEEDLVIAAEDASGMSTKLDLARAYIDMGDDDGARQILEEVVAEGDDALKAEAEALLGRIG